MSSRTVTHATMLTITRILLIVPILYAIYTDYFLVAGMLACVAAATDFFDGYIARTYHQESTLGALLDPLADKLFILGILTMVYYQQRNLVPGVFIIFLWLKELLLLAGASALLLLGRGPIHARASGKIAMACQVGYCVFLFFIRYAGSDIPIVPSVLLAITFLVTLYALGDYAKMGYDTFYTP